MSRAARRSWVSAPSPLPASAAVTRPRFPPSRQPRRPRLSRATGSRALRSTRGAPRQSGALPGALAQAFASHMAPGDPSGRTLSVTINSIYLGGGGPADPDSIRGVATLSGSAGPTRTTRLRATSTYIPSPINQALVEQALHGRVTALSQAFAYWLARRWRR
jgi:hypothetical protein